MLKDTFTIGNMKLPSRLIMAPVDLELSDKGVVSEKQLVYYHERTKSGRVGLAVIEHSFVTANGRATPHQLSIAKEEDIAGLTALVECIHKNGTPVVVQLSHAGAAIKDDIEDEGISPSGIANSYLPSEQYRKADDSNGNCCYNMAAKGTAVTMRNGIYYS